MSFKEKNPLVVALYLPQYYETEYNNKWWEKGYTEWVACKRAKPLYPGHNQPRVPLNNNYYDLSVKENCIVLFTYVFPSNKVEILQFKLIFQTNAIGCEGVVLLHAFS